jgi:hypothetical protein
MAECSRGAPTKKAAVGQKASAATMGLLPIANRAGENVKTPRLSVP